MSTSDDNITTDDENESCSSYDMNNKHIDDINDDINNLIEWNNTLQTSIIDEIPTLESIQTQLESNPHINILYNDQIVDFDELLDELHSKSLKNITEKDYTNFGEQLLSALEHVVFV